MHTIPIPHAIPFPQINHLLSQKAHKKTKMQELISALLWEEDSGSSSSSSSSSTPPQ